MATNSYTGIIETNGNWEKVSTKAGFTFATGKSYTMQLQNQAYLKVSNAEFYIPTYTPFTYKASADDLYIKTVQPNTIVVILENEE